MPCVTSLDTLHRAVAEFAVTDPGLVIEPPALAAARRSLDSAGLLLLLGEVHGVRENPLLIRALMQALGLTSLALEWPGDLAPMIRAFKSPNHGMRVRRYRCAGTSAEITAMPMSGSRSSEGSGFPELIGRERGEEEELCARPRNPATKRTMSADVQAHPVWTVHWPERSGRVPPGRFPACSVARRAARPRASAYPPKHPARAAPREQEVVVV